MSTTLPPRAPALRHGLWVSSDCDLEVLSSMPSELAFAVVAGTLARHREELARNVAFAGGPGAAAQAVLDAIPDLTPVAATLRTPRRDRRPSGRTLTRLVWALRRARVFLEAFAPPTQADDPVLEDRVFDILTKVVFLIDIVDAWRDPRVVAGAAATSRRTG